MDKFLNYFDERYRKSVLGSHSPNDGPVITISRQTGCDAREVALKVADGLNFRLGTTKWRWVDKDIIYSIARELNIDYNRIENYYEGLKLTDLSEMIMAFSGNFVSDLRVKKAIKDVVLSICKEGYVVLVGRGGAEIAREIKDSLHVRLVAPFNWRVDNVMRKKKMDAGKARDYVLLTDKKRVELMKTFIEVKTQDMESLFDLTVNRFSFSVNDTADIILSMFEKKILGRITERRRINTIL